MRKSRRFYFIFTNTRRRTIYIIQIMHLNYHILIYVLNRTYSLCGWVLRRICQKAVDHFVWYRLAVVQVLFSYNQCRSLHVSYEKNEFDFH